MTVFLYLEQNAGITRSFLAYISVEDKTLLFLVSALK